MRDALFQRTALRSWTYGLDNDRAVLQHAWMHPCFQSARSAGSNAFKGGPGGCRTYMRQLDSHARQSSKKGQHRLRSLRRNKQYT